MKVYINNINVWLQGLNDTNSLSSWANGDLKLLNEFTAPNPLYYPKGQLRRLSPYSKVVLHCLDIPEALSNNLPLIFSSQHGDLAKTVTLIKGAASGEELSPTKFALSVHNATSGLFGIATNNTAPTTTVSAGDNTFIEGLIEASMQCQQSNTPVIYSYCDFDVPEEYAVFEVRKPARCITMIISNEKNSDALAAAKISLNNEMKSDEKESKSDFSLLFIRDFYLQKNSLIQNEKYSLSLNFT